MSSRHSPLMLPLAALALLAMPALLLTQLSRADSPMIQISKPMEIQTGVQQSWGSAPFFRFTVQVLGPKGKIETKTFKISSDALFKYARAENADFKRYAIETINVGAVDALWKGGHIGVGFDGITVGEDRDMGYSNMLKTGFYALVNMIVNDRTQVNIHSGFEFESKQINLGRQMDRGFLEQAIDLDFKSHGWNANLKAHIDLDTAHPIDTHYMRAGAETQVGARIGSAGPLEFGVEGDLKYDHDGFRDIVGLMADNVTLGLSMTVAWVVPHAQE
jgi:hypothetical protein